MSKNDLILSLSGDTFSSLKRDFDKVLNRTLGNMEMKGAEDATITMKLSISTEKRSMNVGDGIQVYKQPSFKHEITSVMQIKDKATGQFGGEYCMVWDEEEERFVLRKYSDGQASMFDDDYETVDGEAVPDEERPGLPAGGPALLDSADDGEAAEPPRPYDRSPFDWLMQFVGDEMVVSEAMGNYTVRTKDNKIVLSSATSPDSPFYCPAEKLEPHVGHQVVCAGYGDDEIVNVSIECRDCNTILFDLDAYTEDDQEAEGGEVDVDADFDFAAADDGEDSADYDYDDPEED